MIFVTAVNNLFFIVMESRIRPYSLTKMNFVRERFELSIGIYISMKSTFFTKLESLEKMVKASKFFLAKTKQKKMTSNNKNNKK